MTNMPQFPGWSDDFAKAQRGYWELWTKLTQQTLNSDPAAAQAAMGTWAQGYDRWWSGLGKALPANDHADALNSMFQQGQLFLRMSEGYTRFMSAYSKQADASADWQRQLTDGFDRFKSFLAAGDTQQWGDVSKNLMGFSQMPIDSWMQSMAGLFKASTELASAVRQELTPVTAPMEREASRLLAMPAVGYGRESQEQMQKAIQLNLDHQQSAQKFGMAISRVTAESMDLMLQRLIEKGQKGETITSLRALYDLWVDCSEDVFGRFAMTEEFSLLYGEFVNSMMSLRRHVQQMADDALGQMNLPTRRELTTQSERMHQLRRQVSEMDQRLKDGAGRNDDAALAQAESENARRIASLEAEIVSLRALVEARLAALPTIPAAAPVSAPAVEAAVPPSEPEARPRSSGGGKRGKSTNT